jgi:hypothetical protein
LFASDLDVDQSFAAKRASAEKMRDAAREKLEEATVEKQRVETRLTEVSAMQCSDWVSANNTARARACYS